MNNTLYYADLIAGPEGRGMPFEVGSRDPRRGLDCKGLAFIMMTRAGYHLPELPDEGRYLVKGPATAKYLRRYMQLMEWREVSAEQPYLGDLVVSEMSCGGSHVSVICEANPGSLKVITMTEEDGIVVMPLFHLSGVTNVWRPVR